VISTLKSITPKPTDPKYKLEYVYSVANNGKEYELGGVLEKTIGMNHKTGESVILKEQSLLRLSESLGGRVI